MSEQPYLLPDALSVLRRGTYILILYLRDSQRIQVGKLGRFDFDAGYYAYVGSAQGPGGLGARLRHHLRANNRPHWHIDYLRQIAGIESIWFAESNAPLEHHSAAWLGDLPGAAIPALRFGASDCTCASHLFFFRELPPVDEFRARGFDHRIMA